MEGFLGTGLILPSVQDHVTLEKAHFAEQDIFSYTPNSPSAKQYGEALKVLMQRLELTAQIGGLS